MHRKIQSTYFLFRLASSCDISQKTAEQQKFISELEAKQRAQQEETAVWKEEAAKLRQNMAQMDTHHKRQIQETEMVC